MGNPFVHLKLSTDGVDGAKKFYKKVFDWKFEENPEMTYTMINTGDGKTAGGLTKMMPGQPTAWMPYVEVDSVKKSVAKAQKAGATVVVPFQQIGEMGAIGVFTDPTGATLGVWEMAKKVAPKKAVKKAAKKAAPKKAAKSKPAKRK